VKGVEGEAGSQKPCHPEDASHFCNDSRASLIARKSLRGGVCEQNV